MKLYQSFVISRKISIFVFKIPSFLDEAYAKITHWSSIKHYNNHCVFMQLRNLSYKSEVHSSRKRQSQLHFFCETARYFSWNWGFTFSVSQPKHVSSSMSSVLESRLCIQKQKMLVFFVLFLFLWRDLLYKFLCLGHMIVPFDRWGHRYYTQCYVKHD